MLKWIIKLLKKNIGGGYTAEEDVNINNPPKGGSGVPKAKKCWRIVVASTPEEKKERKLI
jgi:hypothetical protein